MPSNYDCNFNRMGYTVNPSLYYFVNLGLSCCSGFPIDPIFLSQLGKAGLGFSIYINARTRGTRPPSINANYGKYNAVDDIFPKDFDLT